MLKPTPPEKLPRLWCVFNADTGHWKLVNYEKQSAAVNASTAYTRGYEVHEMLARSEVEDIIREAREAAVMKERERIASEARVRLVWIDGAALDGFIAQGINREPMQKGGE